MSLKVAQNIQTKVNMKIHVQNAKVIIIAFIMNKEIKIINLLPVIKIIHYLIII